MKRSVIHIILFVCLIFNVGVLFAQEYETPATSVLLNNKDFIFTEGNILQVNSLNKNEYNGNSNLVNIIQIGNYNYSKINIVSSDSKLAVTQNGDNNYTSIYKKANQIDQSVVQSGSNNFISDFSLQYDDSVKMQINQKGDNLSIYNNGSNSISKNMIINQSGNSGSVYIFNR